MFSGGQFKEWGNCFKVTLNLVWYICTAMCCNSLADIQTDTYIFPQSAFIWDYITIDITFLAGNEMTEIEHQI